MLYQQTLALLTDIRHELQRIEYWQDTPPSDEAMQSRAPFCCDKMTLQAWLQFVLIPKLEFLVQSQQPLPTKIAIAPFAEVAFASDAATTQALVHKLAALDALLSQPADE